MFDIGGRNTLHSAPVAAMIMNSGLSFLAGKTTIYMSSSVSAGVSDDYALGGGLVFGIVRGSIHGDGLAGDSLLVRLGDSIN